MRLGPRGRAAIGRRAVLTGAAALGLGAVASACSSGPLASGSYRLAPTLSQAAALRGQFEASARELLTPGAAMLLRTANGQLASTYGSRTDTGSDPVTLADHVRIGSITKTFTATVILQLAQEGKLDIDAPVSEYRTDVPNGRDITLTQLLNMSSGLYNYAESVAFNRSLDEDPTKTWHPDELLAVAYQYPPYFPPGASFHYSNTNAVLLGLIAEQVGKQALSTAFQTRLLTPLAMHETTLPDLRSTAIADPHPRGYMYGTNVSMIRNGALPPDQQAAARSGALEPTDVTDASSSWAWAAGGVISTAADLATWVRALGDGTLLDPTWQRRRLESVRSTNPGPPLAAYHRYGLGIATFGPMYGHTGDLPGFQSFAAYDPDREATVVVWANLVNAPNGRPPATMIAQQLIGTIYR